MNKDICDDRDQLENVRKIRNMTDEEFEEYINKERANKETEFKLVEYKHETR